MKYLSLLASILCLSGCLSVPELPGLAEQAAAFSRQPFSANYRVAITSYHKDTKVLVDVSTPLVRFVSSEQEARRIAFSEKSRRDDIAMDFSMDAGLYNRSSYVSTIERRFGETLKQRLGVKPVYYERRRIHEMLDAETLETSAMMHAKALAKNDGLDAVLVVYFEPSLVESRDVIGPAYSLRYKTQVAMRSVAGDKLIYHRIRQYPCQFPVSLTPSKMNEAIDSMRACESDIHSKITDDFLDFVDQAGN